MVNCRKMVGWGMLFAVVLFLGTSCSKTGSLSAVALDGVTYTKINPKDYAAKLKAEEIGTGDKFVIEGLVMGTNENTLMLQKAGITNIFTMNEPTDLAMGTKVRIYAELTLVNTVLLKMSEAKVIKLEKL